MKAPRLPRALLPALVVLSGGCAYYNGLYNARRLYEQGERARLAGDDSLARSAYRDAVARADRAYRDAPGGGWADDALYLVGRGRLREGDLEGAREALDAAFRLTDDENVRVGSTLYLGVIALVSGDRDRAFALLSDALARVEDDELRAEGHLWRARLLLENGELDAGWWDLDRAAEADPRYRVSAAVERLAWGITHGDGGRASAGAQTLLAFPSAHARVDTVEALVRRAEDDWGAGPAADLLAGAEVAEWPPADRDRLLLLRARLRERQGDPGQAGADARLVAAGAGPGAVEARLFMADVEARRAVAVEELELLRPLLLPAVEDARALRRLEALRTVQLLARRGRDVAAERIALFAAAELARDVVGAGGVATTLFLEYAERAPASPWVGKALLAALGTADEERRRGVLRDIAARTDDPYVILWRAGRLPDGRYEALEEGLAAAMASVLSEVTAEARSQDQILLQRPDTSREGGRP